MRLFADAKYDFLSKRRFAFVLLGAFIIPGLIIAVFRGVNYSVEFTGGTLVQIKTVAPVEVGVLRQRLDEFGVTGAEIQSIGSNREFNIRARVAAAGTDADDTGATGAAVARALDAAVGAGQYTIELTEAVGPKVGSELRQKAVLAILLSFVAVLLYLWYRFEWRFGAAAVLATAHDILAIIAFIGAFRIEVSLFVVAALLSTVGYSLNDTIVIFDRVRENLRKSKREDFIQVLNRSINETLPRTILTGGTSLGALIALAVFGGAVVRPFAVIMTFGIIVGTYSSIFIASPLLLWIERRWPGADIRGVKGTAKKQRVGKPQPVA